MNRNTHFLIVGLGLIGGCYARRLTALGYTVDALDIDPGALDYAKEEGIIARTSIEGTSSICYRFLPDAPEDVYFFLKCEALRACYRAPSRTHQPHEDGAVRPVRSMPGKAR